MKPSGARNFTINYLESARTDLPFLGETAKLQIQKVIQAKLTVDPAYFGKPLRYSLKGHRSLRVGDYRVIYRIDSKKHIVYVVAIGHRRDVYDE